MSGSSTTPPSAPFSTAEFSDAERADIRRFCGFPPYGAGPSGFQGWRFFQAYGVLEYRMGVQADGITPNLAPAELQNVRYYLSLLYPVEAALAAMYATIEVAVAASFTRNAAELEDRRRHFDGLRRVLCNVVGIIPGPDLGAGGLRIQA